MVLIASIYVENLLSNRKAELLKGNTNCTGLRHFCISRCEVTIGSQIESTGRNMAASTFDQRDQQSRATRPEHVQMFDGEGRVTRAWPSEAGEAGEDRVGDDRPPLARRAGKIRRQAKQASPKTIVELWGRTNQPLSRREGRAARQARAGRQPLPRSGMVEEPVLRLLQAGLSARRRTGRTIWSATPKASRITRASGRNSI